MRIWSGARPVVAAFFCILVHSAPTGAQTHEPPPALKEVPVAPSSFSLGEPVPSWVEPATMPETTSTDPIVIRLSDIQLSAGVTPTTYVHRAMKVNNAASLNGAGQIPIPFAPDYQKLQLHAIGIIRGSEKHDRTTSATIRFVQRETGLEQGVYRGQVTALIVMNDIRVGDTLEVSYSLHGQNPVFGGKFIDGASWDQPYPTDYRRIILNSPVERQISWRLIGDRQSTPPATRESTDAGWRKLVLEERGVPASPTEPAVPSDYVAHRWMQFSEFRDWKEVASWANDLFKVNGSLNDELRGIIEKLRRRPSSEERITAALEFVQAEIRYFSVALGESSHRPAPPDVVLSRRYGDCKDKSLLLLTILKELGIPGKAVLMQSGRRKGLEKSLPSPQAFDHVIVQTTVDGKDFYLDPTRLGQHGRLSRMGQGHEGAQILFVDSATHEPSILPASAPETYLSVLSEKATLTTMDGEAELEVRETWTGLMAERNRVLFAQMPRDQVTRALAESVERLYPGAKTIRSVDISDDQVNNTISTVALYRVPKFAIERDGYWLLRYTPSNMGGALPTPNSTTRKDPLHVANFLFRTKYIFEAKLPDNVSMVSDPLTKTVRNKHFAYAIAASFRGNRAKAELDLSILADRIEAVNIQAYATDLREANNVPTGAIVVPKGAIRTAARGPVMSLTDQIKYRQQERIKKTTAAINSGKFSGSELADLYCNRATAYSNLERATEAIKDADRALKNAPDSVPLLNCRAEIYFTAGQFDKSVSDFSRIIALGNPEPNAFYRRGISKFYTGSLEEAAADLVRASENDDHDAQLYSDMWAMWTLRRLGRPIPDAIMKRAAAQPHGEWPRPALAMLAGKMTPEEMLRIVNEKKGDDRHMALAEGYFYLGQHYLAQGKKAQAIEYFEKTRRQNVILYIEHQAAKFELASRKKGR